MDSLKITGLQKQMVPLTHALPRPIDNPRTQEIANQLAGNLFVENIESNQASEFYKRIEKWIADFDQSLDNEHEVGIRLVNFGQTVIFHLEDIGYWNPSLLVFKGVTEDNSPVELIQHVSQINILLMKLPRKNPEKPKRSIGFLSEEN